MTHTMTKSAILVVAFVGAACASNTPDPDTDTEKEAATQPASGGLSATLQALGDSGVAGTLTFTAVEGGVKIQGTITGLAADSEHGFHIHEKGDCSAPDGTSAGGHFNPKGHAHGALEAAESHVGDLSNVKADASGTATVDVVKAGATLTDGDSAILGRGVIVHEKADDLTTQPTGAAGGRIACAVIVAAE